MEEQHEHSVNWSCFMLKNALFSLSFTVLFALINYYYGKTFTPDIYISVLILASLFYGGVSFVLRAY